MQIVTSQKQFFKNISKTVSDIEKMYEIIFLHVFLECDLLREMKPKK